MHTHIHTCVGIVSGPSRLILLSCSYVCPIILIGFPFVAGSISGYKLAIGTIHLNTGVDTSDGSLSILLYVDDTAMITPLEENLQRMLGLQSKAFYKSNTVLGECPDNCIRAV